MTLYYGDTYTLKVKNAPKQATVKWSTSKKSVATIDKKGKLTAKKSGSAKITTKVYANGKKIKTFTAKVKVNNPSFKDTKSALYVGKKEHFSINKASKAKVAWSSSNPSVAKVDKWGDVKANAIGKATIFAKVTLNKKTTTLKKTVAIKNVTLSETSIVMDETDTRTVTLSGAKIIQVRCNGNIAPKIQKDGISVELKGSYPGKTTLQITTSNGTIEYLPITVTANVDRRKGSINPLYVITTEKTGQLTFDQHVSNWSKWNKIVSCTSADPTIATVTATGEVTGQSLGDTTITVTDNYGFTYTAKVKVTKPYLSEPIEKSYDSGDNIILPYTEYDPIFDRTVELEGDGEEEQNPNSTSTAIGSGNDGDGVADENIILNGATIQSAVSSDPDAIQITSISQNSILIRTAYDVYAGNSNITITDTEGNNYVCKVHIKFVPGTYDWHDGISIYRVKATNQGYILMEQSWRNEEDIPDYDWEPTVTATTEAELQAVQDAVTKYKVVAYYAAMQAEKLNTCIRAYGSRMHDECVNDNFTYKGVTYNTIAEYVLAKYGQADYDYCVFTGNCRTYYFDSEAAFYPTNYDSSVVQNFINAHKNDSSYYQYYSWVDCQDFNGNTHSLDEAYQWFLYWTGAKPY